ncbi:MAG TPA: DNA polymerase I, partial [Gammaproteobacteria bacterium]|nr:DNA polymerase I [Gammaproteobacteria bacterium]
LPLICVEGVEADDVIGTYATMVTVQQRETVISTGDKDMAQLVTDHVSLVNTMTETHMDRQGVIEKFGVAPEQIVDYLALMGDSVDNIPGVPKVGPKTAAKWLSEYGSLDELMQRAEEIKGKIGENLRASLEQLPLSRALTQIKCDVELALSLEQLQQTEPDHDYLRTAFTRLEFKSWLEALETGASAVDAAPPVEASSVVRDYHLVTSEQELKQWIDEL